MNWPVYWQTTTARTHLLRGLVPAYRVLAWMNRRREQARRQTLPVPVIVAGNLVVGGTGKTPFIRWLIEELRDLGCRPGLVSRGYGRNTRGVQIAGPGSSAQSIGDEPFMIHESAGLPVAVGDDRLQAARTLLQHHPGVSVIVSDDGLQHRRLPRQYVFCLFDGVAGAGNGRLLPAGPLRESLSVLRECDRLVFKGTPAAPVIDSVDRPHSVMRLALSTPLHLGSGRPWGAAHRPSGRVVALCGIGQPRSFFHLLESAGWSFEPQILGDHQNLTAGQLSLLKERTVLMTRKDAVKLPPDHGLCDAWEIDLDVSFSKDDRHRIRTDLVRCLTEGEPR